MLEKTRRLSQNHAWQLDKGLVRETNEDSLMVMESLQISEAKEHLLGIYVVADGVAGMPYGERASRTAAQVASQVFLHQFQTQESVKDACSYWVKCAVEMAHIAVQTSNHMSSPSHSATTLVMAVVLDNRLYVANVGDSRAYVISCQEIRQVSQDHTMAALLVEAGVLSPEEANKPSQRNRLSQALGIGEAISPYLHSETLFAGDYLLLCSDGLYNHLDDDRIFQIVKESDSPHDACEALVDAANDAGGKDNISVILVKMQWA